MRRRAALCLLLGLSLPTAAVAGEPAPPRHPLSQGVPIDEVVPPAPRTGSIPGIRPVAPEEPVERRSRQPTQPPRIKATERPAPPPPPIEMKSPLTRPAKPTVPIGTIDPRPGTIRTHPGTIEAK